MKFLVIILAVLASANVSAEAFVSPNTGITANDTYSIGNSILFKGIVVKFDGSKALFMEDDAISVCAALEMAGGTVNKAIASDSELDIVADLNDGGTLNAISTAKQIAMDNAADPENIEKISLIKDLICDRIIPEPADPNQQ